MTAKEWKICKKCNRPKHIDRLCVCDEEAWSQVEPEEDTNVTVEEMIIASEGGTN